MLKYMLTTRCNRKCSYCITKNIKSGECGDLDKVTDRLKYFRHKNREIMLTGGEPSLSKYFMQKVVIANMIYDKVYITTQNPHLINNKVYEMFFKAISFSLHGLVDNPPKVITNRPVYANILADQYFKELPFRLKKLGYRGLTVNEEQRNGQRFNESILPKIEDFSIKVNRKGHCMDDTIILPDLTVITDFRKVL